MSTHRVLISDKLAREGVEVFEAAPGISVDVKTGLSKEQLLEIIGDYDALVIRSATKVTAEVLAAAGKLRVVGRAGIGVDNVDVPEASRRGVIVMNTPEGNVVTTAEHAVSMMAALARRIPQATASMKAGKWEKSKFEGSELYNKTLGVIGLGRIGKIVASRGLGLKMKVLAYDPFVSAEQARDLGLELGTLDEVLSRSDFITLHVPMLDSTRGMIDAGAIEKMKKGAYLINCARGGLVDEAKVAEAVSSGRLAGAAFDVYEEEPPPASNPLLSVDNIILTPHLGASTAEAQTNVAVDVAHQIVAFLNEGAVMNAVNAPSVSAEVMALTGPWMRVARTIGALAGQLHSGGLKRVHLRYRGKTFEGPVDPISVALLTGLLGARWEDINEVNAPLVAEDRGIECIEERSATAKDFAALVGVRIEGDEGQTEVEGTLIGASEPLIVRVNGVRIEVVPEGHVLMTQHRDKPGMIGKIGGVLGAHEVNISRMAVSQIKDSDGLAQAALSIDAPVNESVLKEIRGVDGIESVTPVSFD